MMPPVARPTLQPVCCGAPGPVLLRHPGRDRGGRGGGVRHVSAGRLYPGTRVSSACPGDRAPTVQTCCPPGQVYAEDQYWEPPACSEEGEETTVLLYTVLYSTVLLSTDDIFIL